MRTPGAGRALRLGALASLCVLVAGCGSGPGDSPPKRRQAAIVPYPMVVPQGSLLLYRVDTNRLVTFDPVRKVVNGTGNAPQTFQYPFAGRQDLYTSGSSSTYGFELLKVGRSDIETLATLTGRRGLFPLASEGHVVLLLVVDYDARSRPAHQQVVRLAGSSLTPVPGLDHAGISSGALIGGVLFYTVYRKKLDRYDLRRVKLRSRGSAPRTVRSGLRDGPLHTFAGKLVLDFRVAGTSRPVDCDEFCLFSETAGVVVSVTPSSSGARALSVSDPVARTTFGSIAGDVVGFTLGRRAVEVYGIGLHERIAIAR